jgi:hypothetical protein
MSIRKRIQCKACPWKVSTNPAEDIPGGYSLEKHRALQRTIAPPGALSGGPELRMMACHETTGGQEEVCIGWLRHQLNEGNNIPLRLAAMGGRFGEWETVGEQHTRFEDTLPEGA